MHKFAVIDIKQVGDTLQLCILNLETFSELWVSPEQIIPSAIESNKIRGLSYKNNQLVINLPRSDCLFYYLRFFHRNCLFEFARDINTFDLLDISYLHRYKVSWRCKVCGGVFESSPRYRFSKPKNRACPYCSGKILKTGVNDLETTDRQWLSEWDYNKNLVKPSQISRKYQGKIWWRCKTCNAVWKESLQTYLTNASLGLTTCPKCEKEHLKRGTSNPELQLYSLIARHYDCSHRGKLRGVEFDILSKEYMFAIEYDGYEWHKDSLLQDINKNKIANREGYYLIRIRERGLPAVKGADCINIMLKHYNSTSDCFKVVLKNLQELIDGQ